MLRGRRIAVIGSGLVGASCAVALARDGNEVTLIDQGQPGHGCSYANGAQYNAGSSLPMSHPGVVVQAARWFTQADGPVRFNLRDLAPVVPWLIQFIRTGRPAAWRDAYQALHALNAPCAALYRELIGANEWQRLSRAKGALHVWRSGGPGAAAMAMRSELGVAVDVLNAADIHALEPALARDFVRGLFFRDSGHVVSPVALVEALVASAIGRGVDLQQAHISKVALQDNSVTLHTGTNTLTFDSAIVAAGFATRQIAASLGVSLPIASERGYSVTLPHAAGLISRPVTDASSAFVATPIDEGMRVVGIAEFADAARPPTSAAAAQLVTSVAAMVPAIDIRDVTSWMGVRPSTPDSLPVIAAHPKAPQLIFASGHGHMGISGAPMTAELVASLVTGRPSAIDMAPFRIR